MGDLGRALRALEGDALSPGDEGCCRCCCLCWCACPTCGAAHAQHTHTHVDARRSQARRLDAAGQLAWRLVHEQPPRGCALHTHTHTRAPTASPTACARASPTWHIPHAPLAATPVEQLELAREVVVGCVGGLGWGGRDGRGLGRQVSRGVYARGGARHWARTAPPLPPPRFPPPTHSPSHTPSPHPGSSQQTRATSAAPAPHLPPPAPPPSPGPATPQTGPQPARGSWVDPGRWPGGRGRAAVRRACAWGGGGWVWEG